MDRGRTLLALPLLAALLAVAAPAASAQPVAKPKVARLQATTRTVGSSGGTVTIRATVSRAKKCVFAVTPKVAGFGKSMPCASPRRHTARTVTRALRLPPNPFGTPVVYTVRVTAKKGAIVSRKQVKVTVAGAAPSIAAFTATSTTLPSTGGQGSPVAAVRNATSCTLAQLSGPATLPGLPATVGCSAPRGQAAPLSFHVQFPANTTSAGVGYTLQLTAASAVGHVNSQLMMTVAAAPVRALSWTRSPIPGTTSSIVSVSCPAAGWCMAMNAGGTAFVFDGSSWTSKGQIFATPGTEVVSCAEPAYCIAVNGSSSSDSDASFWSGTSWSSEFPIDHLLVTDVSCAKGTSYDFCDSIDSAGHIASTQSGTGWSAAAPIFATSSKTSISCFSTTFCAAVSADGKAVTYDNVNGWSLPTTIDAAAATTKNGPITLSCGAVGSCQAVTAGGVGYDLSGGSWQLSGLDDTVGAAATTPTFVVSCATSSVCFEADAAGHLDSFNGASWTDTGAAAPAAIATLSCPTTSYCLGTDGTDSDIGTA